MRLHRSTHQALEVLIRLCEARGDLEEASELRACFESRAGILPAPTPAADSPPGGRLEACPTLASPVLKQSPKDSLAMVEPGQSSAPLHFSVVILTFNNLVLTRQCLDSVYHTIDHEKGEVIVVDNASSDGTVEFLRQEGVAGRLRALFNGENVGFAKACNQGAQVARGELLIFLNNDTITAPGWVDTLLAAAKLPQVGIVGCKLLYPDGRIQHAGVGFVKGQPDHPHRFARPDAPETNQFRELDMVTGACLAISKRLFFQVGGFDEIYRNGVEDIDLCLRVRAAGYKVVYEPGAIAVHFEGRSTGRYQHARENLRLFRERWRGQFDESLRFRPPSGPRILLAEKSILRQNQPPQQLEQLVKPATAGDDKRTFVESGIGVQKAVSIIIPVFNQLALTRQCLKATRDTVDPRSIEILVLDNASADETWTFLQEEELKGQLTAIRNPENLGFAKACNLAAREARGEFLLFLNNDTIPKPGWLGAMQDLICQDSTVGVVGSRLLYPDGTIQHAGISLDDHGLPYHVCRRMAGEAPEALVQRDFPAVTGACLLMRRSVFEKLRGFDESYSMYVEDVDLCLRVWEVGYRVVYCPRSVVTHFESASIIDTERRDIQVRDGWSRLLARWSGRWPEVLKPLLPAVLAKPHPASPTSTRLPLPEHKSADREVKKSVIPRTGKSPMVVWLAPFFSSTGYGDEARNFILNLDRQSLDVMPMDMGGTSEESKSHLSLGIRDKFDSLLRKQISLPFFCVIHGPGYTLERCDEAAYCVGRTMFETDRLPPDWVERCNRMDEIWVPSQLTLEAFHGAGVRVPLTKIPEGVDTERFRPGLEPLSIPGARKRVFLSIFEWIYRKGWDVLLAAWAKAFKATDDVCLVLRTYPPNGADRPDAQALIEQRINDCLKHGLGIRREDIAPIIVLAGQIPESDMPRLYATAHAYVSPSRGEGWGRTPMEAMACGLPTIATRWGGTQEFMNDQNSLQIDYSMVEVDERCEIPFYRGHRWAEPSVEHLATLLRRVIDEPSTMVALGQRAREDMVTHWQWDRVAGIVEDRLREIEQDLLRRDEIASGRASNETEQTGLGERVRSPSEPVPVLWSGLFYNSSGYAEEARHFVQGLDRKHVNLAIRPFAQASESVRSQLGTAEREKLDQLLSKDVETSFIGVVHTSGRCLERLPGAAYCIGRTMFETDRLPPDWVEKCNRMDEIWVPTEHSLESFRNSGVKARLVKIPGGVDTERFRPGLNPLPIPGRRKSVFLSIFEWSYRKGWDVLLHSWAKAFKPHDDVCLVLRAYPLNAADAPDATREINLFIDAFLNRCLKLDRAEVAPIIVLGRPIPECDLPRLYAAATAYVAPSRGEGWGRPQMDAMACGLPVIATGWSGTREFMTEQNSLLLDYNMVEVGADSEIEYFRGHQWAEPSREHLVQLLRRVVERPEEMARLGTRARQDMVEKWQWDRVAELAAKRLAEISEELRAKARSAGSISRQLSVVSDQSSVISDPSPHSVLRAPHPAISQELARQGRIPSYKRESVHSMNDPSRKDDAHGSSQKPDLEIGLIPPEANRLLERADAEYRKGNLANARAVLLEALHHVPNSPKILATLGAISFSLNEFAAAKEHFSKAAALAPNDPGVRVQLALAQLELNQIDDFEATLRRALELDPNHRDALKLLADLNLKQGQFTDAARTYAKIITRYPDDLDSLLGLGACFFKGNEWETAQEVYERILLISPNHSLAANNLAAIKKKLEERASAGISDQRSVVSDQSSQSALRTPHSALDREASDQRPKTKDQGPEGSASNAQLSTPNPQRSTPHSALRTPHSEADRLLERADWESQNGNHLSARQILEQALQTAPNDPRIIEQLGMASFALNDFIAAQNHFNRLTEIKPSDASAFVQLALTHLKLERIDQFEMALGHALDLDPYHRDALKLLADLNLRNDRFKDAAQAYTKILSRHPDDLDALLPLGVCFFKVHDYETAKLVFERVLEKHPGNPVAKENLEVIRQKMSSAERPASSVEWSSQLSVVSDQLQDQRPGTKDPEPRESGQKSEVRSQKSEEPVASSEFQAPESQPTAPHSALRTPDPEIDRLLEQAGAEHAQGNLTRAKQLVIEALRLAPDEPRTLAMAGTICFALNEFDPAYRYLQRATEVNRRDSAVFVQLALVNLKLEQIEEFEVALSRALEIDPHHRDALKLLGDLNFQNNRLKDAAQAYTKILSRHPDDVDALLPLGVCFFKDGDLVFGPATDH